MHRKFVFLSFLILTAASVLAAGPTQVTGYITNKACDARAMKADAEACMRKCKEQGQVQFVDDAQNKVWDISNAEKVAQFTGEKVQVTANFDAAKKTVEILSAKKLAEKK